METRNDDLAGYSQDSAIDALCKAKALVMAYLESSGNVATTKQVAEYYGVLPNTITQLYKRHKEEFASDGTTRLTKKKLKSLTARENDILSLSGNEASLVLWTPRSVLRIGMLLTESEVAQEVRNVLLDAIAGAANELVRTTNELTGALAEIARLKAELAKSEQSNAQYEKWLPIVLEEPKPWTLHYDEQWRAQAERITGYSWEHRCMSGFINRAVYNRLPAKMRKELERVNPVDPETGRRKHKQHQHVPKHLEKPFQDAIHAAYVLMTVCESQQEFLSKIAGHHQGWIQLGIPGLS